MKIPASFRKNRSFLATRIQTSWLPVMLTLTALSQAPLSAQSLWTAGSGSWSTDFNWDPMMVPVSDPATHLVFQSSGGNYTTTNDIGLDTFILNRITVANTGTGTVTITGASTTNTFTFAGDNPTLDITGTTLFTGLMAGSATITKVGPGTFIHDSNNGGFTGTLIINQGTFVNRSTTFATTNFNPVSIVVNNGATYQFGAATTGNPNLPNSTYITVNTGGTVNWQEGEDFGGFHLLGGTINLQQGNTNLMGTTPQNWTHGSLTGANFTVAGNNTITKTTSGTVFVTGNVAINSAGGIAIQEGTVSLASAVNLGTANVTLGDGATTTGTLSYLGATASRVGDFTVNVGGGRIDVASATTILTLTGAITGNGPLTKVGPGKLRLAGALGSSGPTNIAAGVLQVEPVAAFGSFIVAAGTTLAVNSGLGATSFMPTSVNLADGTSTLQFDLDTNTVPAAPLAVISDFDGLLRTGTPTLRLTNLQAFADGTYTLVDYDGAPISSGYNLDLPGRTAGSLVYNTENTRIDVLINGTDSVKWTGLINGDWDLGTAAGVGGTNNWALATAGSATNFIDTDSITFDDTATRRTVNLTTTVQPFSTVVNANSDYTISGPGKISGSTALTKSGTGTLVLATDNDYTGGTTVTGGAMQVGNGGTTGSVVGTVTLNGGALSFNRSDNFAFNNTIVVGNTTSLIQNGSGIPTISTPLATGANIVEFSGTGNLTMGATVSGNGILNKNGAGTLTLLANNNTFTGILNVNAGKVLLDDLGAGGDLGAASVVINNSGTFVFGPGGNVDFPDTTLVTINSGGLFQIEQGENYGGNILNGGELRFVSTTRTGVNSTGVAAVAGATVHDLRSGTITTDITAPGAGGALNQTNGGVLTKSTAGTVTISGGVTFQNTLELQIKEGTLAMGFNNVPAGGTARITLGDAINTGTLKLNGTGNAFTGRPFTMDTGGGIIDVTDANSSLAINGLVSGPGPLVKHGDGSLVISNGNDYLGNTTVIDGTLEATNVFGSATGSGSVTIEGTLAGDGAIVTGVGNSVFLEGIFQPGATGAFFGTDFSITTGIGGSAVFGAGSIARFDLWSTTGTDQSSVSSAADLLLVAGDLQITPGAMLKLTNPNSLTFQDGDVFRLFDWSGGGMISGGWSIDSADLNLGNLFLDTSNLYSTGTIGITAVPEPGSTLLMILGFGTFALRRRRKPDATR